MLLCHKARIEEVIKIAIVNEEGFEQRIPHGARADTLALKRVRQFAQHLDFIAQVAARHLFERLLIFIQNVGGEEIFWTGRWQNRSMPCSGRH